MTQTSKYVEEVHKLLANLNQPDKDGEAQQPPDLTQPIREIDVYIEDDRITFIPKTPPQERIIDSVPAAEPAPAPQAIDVSGDKKSERIAYGILSFSVLMLLSIILLQIYFLMNPPIATITLIARSQQLTVNGTLQMGRVLNPITISQSQTVPTTGKGHQNARSATGTIIFYNGQLQSVFVPAGTILMGNDGVQIITDQDAHIPAANPPTWGITTVLAHTIHTGSRGNIASYDINQGCCAGVKAVNSTSFSGGEDEHNFQTVAKNDIDNAATPLKATLNQGVSSVLRGQVKATEALATPSCTTNTTASNRPGEEAATVKVTVSETCSAVAYNQDVLQTKVTDLLNRQALKQLGNSYKLLDTVQVSISQATANHTNLVFLTFHAQSTWAYALSKPAQEHIKQLIAGKTKQAALHILASQPGIESVSTPWGDDTKLPKNISYIHLLIFSTQG